MKERVQAQGITEQTQNRFRTGTRNFEAMHWEVLGQVITLENMQKT